MRKRLLATMIWIFEMGFVGMVYKGITPFFPA
jgi:hypothetical protein